jgi:hypothetical protein
MSQKKPPEPDSRVVAVLDSKTMRKVEKLAARYGIAPEDVLRELIRMELSEPPEGTTVH